MYSRVICIVCLVDLSQICPSLSFLPARRIPAYLYCCCCCVCACFVPTFSGHAPLVLLSVAAVMDVGDAHVCSTVGSTPKCWGKHSLYPVRREIYDTDYIFCFWIFVPSYCKALRTERHIHVSERPTAIYCYCCIVIRPLAQHQ